MNKNSRLLLPLIALLTLTQPSLAFSGKDTKDMEVIEITGERPVYYFSKIRYEKAEAFMQAFNANVDDKDLAFECERVARIGTLIKKTVCLLAYTWRIDEKSASHERWEWK